MTMRERARTFVYKWIEEHAGIVRTPTIEESAQIAADFAELELTRDRVANAESYGGDW